MARFVFCLLLEVLLAGCVSYPVTEFRGTAVNIDGNGHVESGSWELGSQRSGTTGDVQFLALSLSEVAEFRLLYPRGQSLRTIDPRLVSTWLVRGLAQPLPESTAAQSEIELTGPIRIKFKDNIDFAIRVDLKGPRTNEVELHGEFLAYSAWDFEPMTYLAAIPMLFGFAETSFGPARTKTRQGDMSLVRRTLAALSRRHNPRASTEILIVAANRYVTFAKTSVLKNPIGIRFSFAVNSTADTALRSKMESACREMGLNLKVAPSRNLNNPTVETEPHFLSVQLCGEPAEVMPRIVEVLQRVFAVTEESRFKITE